MEDIFEKMLELNEQEDRYDVEKNLRSQIIDMFYKEGFSMTDEQKSATGTHYEFTKLDRSEPDAPPIKIKVFLEDKN